MIRDGALRLRQTHEPPPVPLHHAFRLLQVCTCEWGIYICTCKEVMRTCIWDTCICVMPTWALSSTPSSCAASAIRYAHVNEAHVNNWCAHVNGAYIKEAKWDIWTWKWVMRTYKWDTYKCIMHTWELYSTPPSCAAMLCPLQHPSIICYDTWTCTWVTRKCEWDTYKWVMHTWALSSTPPSCAPSAITNRHVHE